MKSQTIMLPAASRAQAAQALAAKAQAYAPGERVRVTLELASVPRTLEQNSGVYQTYKLIALQSGDTLRNVRRECKLCHGVPILRADDAEFRAAYDRAIKPLAYEIKLEVMDYWPVTSRMSKPQLSQYLSELQLTYNVSLERAA